jgi:hypothetical protein
LKASDLQGRQVRVQIASCALEELGDDEVKPVLRFVGKEAGLVLNVTNAGTIAAALGDETEGWIGRQLLLYVSETDLRGKRVPCIRVRVEAGGPPVHQPPPPPPVLDDEPDDIPF